MGPKWKKAKRVFVLVFLAATIGFSAYAYTSHGIGGTAATLVTSLCLALGFWLTENLVGLVTRVRHANSTATALLLVGKLGWWLMLFLLVKKVPAGLDMPLLFGMGAFLLALLSFGLAQAEWPKISDGKGPGES